jgi:hypothetical protein
VKIKPMDGVFKRGFNIGSVAALALALLTNLVCLLILGEIGMEWRGIVLVWVVATAWSAIMGALIDWYNARRLAETRARREAAP